MASLFINLCRCCLLLAFLSCFRLSGASYEFKVGGDNGWVVPLPTNSNYYNQWAAKNRFQIGDTLIFKYNQDSVMVVNETDYNWCNSSHPIIFFNNGKTVFKFDRSGLFYFISGVAGHCQRGQKMIVRVMNHPSGPAPENAESPQGGKTSPANTPSSAKPSAAVLATPPVSTSTVSLVLFSLFLGSAFF